MSDDNLPKSNDNPQVQDGAKASGEGSVAVGNSGIYVGGGVGGDVLGAGATKTVITGEETYQVHGLPNPYLGLRSFTYDDREAFAGRDTAIRRAVEILSDPGKPISLMFITGASGSGKSSFVQAGLVPALEAHYSQRHKQVNYAIFRPSFAPMAMLADGLAQLGFPQISAEQLASFTPEGFNRCLSDNTPLNQVNVLVIDQFEECFTQCSSVQRERLFAFLTGLANFYETRTHMIVTLRSDYLDELFNQAALWQIAKEGIELRAMTEGELKEAIQQPLHAAGQHDERYRQKRFESALLNRLAEDAAKNSTYLPLLQVTLQELWKGGSLVLERYGQLTDGIRQRAEDVYGFEDHDLAAPNRQRSQADKDEILKILTDLVEVALNDDRRRDVRRQREKTVLAGGSNQRARLMDSLVTARLLSPTTKTDGEKKVVVVDIIHESLINNWTRLRDAVDEKLRNLQRRARFEQALAEWRASDFTDDYLLSGIHLAEGRELERAEDVALRSSGAQKFLYASQAKEEAAQRRRTRIAWSVVVGLSILATVAVLAALIARTQLEISRSRELAAIAREQLDRDPELALLISIEAAQASETFQAEDVLRQSLAADYLRAVLRGHELGVTSAAFSPDGQRVVTTSYDGTARLWNAESGKELAVLRGHEDEVYSAAFSPDGQRVVSASYDHMARLWNAESGDELAVLRGHEDDVRSAAFSPDGQRVVTASLDNTARLWDAKSGKLLAVLRGHEDKVWSAAFSPDGQRVVTASDDGTARLWDAESGEELLVVLRGRRQDVPSVAFSPDGKRVVSAGGDGMVIWDAESGEELAVLRGHEAGVTSMIFSPDGQRVVTASNDRTARLWDAESGDELAVLRGHEDGVRSAAFSPDGKRVVTASADGTARLWDAESGDELGVLRGHEGYVTSAAFSPDGKRVLTASLDHTARLWDSEGGEVLRGHEDDVRSAAFSSDGQRVVTASSDGTARLWNAESGDELVVLRGHLWDVTSAAFSPDGQRVLTSSGDDTAGLWDSESGKLLTLLRGHEDGVTSAAFSPDGKRMVTASNDRTARLWDSESGGLLAVLRGHEGGVTSAAFSPDGQRVVTASGDGTARLWDAESGDELAVLRGHESMLNRAAFSPDGKRVVTASYDKTARLWDAESGDELVVLRGHEYEVTSAAFSPDGKRVVTASGDGTARLWDAESGEELVVLRGHENLVYSAAFSPDGRRVLTASGDGTARLWDAESGDELAVLRGHQKAVTSATFSPDGQRVLTGSLDDTSQIYLVYNKDLIFLAKQRLTRQLTCEERVLYLSEARVCPTPTPTVIQIPFYP